MSAPGSVAVLVLGDQLSDRPAALAGLPSSTPVLMIEARAESDHVWSHKARIALFLSAMRHAAAHYAEQGLRVEYTRLDCPELGDMPRLGDRLAASIRRLGLTELRLVQLGDLRLEQQIRHACEAEGCTLEILDDPHFLSTPDEFARWAKGRKQLRMEHFYREMRRRYEVLMEADGSPTGGDWNYDADNRASFGRQGPEGLPVRLGFEPDEITQEVFALVEREFPEHPGVLDRFRWPVTRPQALQALAHFIDDVLPGFGAHQDAMWTDMPFGWHSLLSTSLNLHLLDPREVIAAAERKARSGAAPLSSVEGFIRQILGWREFIRGVYFLEMPGLREANGLGAEKPLPAWFWTGKTQMACMRDAIGQTLEYGYAHHIQRLMVTGLFGLIAGLRPQEVEDWYHAVYVDAVEWAELPNVAGMALYANEGRFTSKPYAASGAYIKRMSNYCGQCIYRPDRKTGPGACPMTAYYWGFLDRHQAWMARNPRTALMAKSILRLSDDERQSIRQTCERLDQQMESL